MYSFIGIVAAIVLVIFFVVIFFVNRHLAGVKAKQAAERERERERERVDAYWKAVKVYDPATVAKPVVTFKPSPAEVVKAVKSAAVKTVKKASKAKAKKRVVSHYR